MEYRGYTYKLYPSSGQEQLFSQFAGVCRLIWNLCLEQRINHWRNYQSRTGNNLNFVSQSRELTKLRKEVDFIRDVSQTAEQRAIKNLEAAFQSFFKGRGGFPKFKKSGANDSFSFIGREVRVEQINAKWSRIKLPKIGWVKLRMTRPVPKNIREATITRTPIGWQVSIGCLVCIERNGNQLTVGVDRGVSRPLVLSDGTSYGQDMIAITDRLEARHKKAQKIASRRKRGSKRHQKAVLRAARIKAKQARARKHWAHVTTTDICRRFGCVVVERLRTKNMTRSAKGTAKRPGRNVSAKAGLNRAILNVGWHRIEVMLSYKSARLERVDPAHTSQCCSACGTVDKQSRKSQASFVCNTCGHRSNADWNAAINIYNRGNAAVLDVEGVVHKHPFEASTSLVEIPVL